MQDSTAARPPVQASPGPVVFEVRCLWRCLAAVPDRRHRRGKRYALPLLLLLMVLAKLSGQDRPSGIADWVAHRRDQLAPLLGLPLARAPHHNPYRRLLAPAPGRPPGWSRGHHRPAPLRRRRAIRVR